MLLLVGDFNFDLLKYDKNKQVINFFNMMTSNLLQPHILGPTRFLDNIKPSLNDNIFLNFIDKNCHSGNFYAKISDHLPGFIIIDDFYANIIEQPKMFKRNMKEFDQESFIKELELQKLLDHIREENDDDVNVDYDKFHEHFLKTLDKYAPMKAVSKRERKQKLKPWITKGMRKSINVKNQLYTRFIKTNDTFYYNRYKTMRDKINHLLRSEKQKYYSTYFDNNKENMKKIWSKINCIIHRKKTSSNGMCLNIEGNIISNPQEVGNKFNIFYTTIAQQLVNKLPPAKINYKNYLTNIIPETFFMSPTTPDEVETLIKNLNVSKSSDIYDILVKIIKLVGPHISIILSNIFNKSFSRGVFPHKLKYAFVLPLHKGGSKLIVSNYRPISILPIFSKLLEQLMQIRLVKFLYSNNIIYEHQFGFQQNKSTSLAVMDLHSKIVEAIENKKIACGVFLDFAKAFDTVNHDILLGKLEHYGIRGLSNKWFQSYLTNRYQRVKIGSILSDENLITCGVPQGSVLGPILFLIYI